ncbi:MAG TPA: UDP-N-acetylmuramate--L-alanine ligase [Anaerolineae bacterium]|nr:UDP-N-acetylmuramate--L-alanine ligase [Anaerolineae bacterium]HRV92176.1 UDP-N-acetylmuramate--L-alanine ligase [Anaerolineae bacterium]
MPTVHLIGIGGAGLSAIATVLLQQGYQVSGSDLQASTTTARLEALGATVYIGQRAENLSPAIDTVIVSSAVSATNPELQAARQLGLAVCKRDEWLGRMMAGYEGIAVAGTHGKTTTTAMTAFMLERLGQNPTYIVGGFIPQLDRNAAAGAGRAFVIEADEYDHMFLGLRPTVAVVTIVEWDHPDIFPTPERLYQAFTDFVQLVPADGLVIGCGDAPGVDIVTRSAQAPVVTYGLQADNDWQAVEVTPNERGGSDFGVVRAGELAVTVSLAVPGWHNVQNALAALVVAGHQQLNLPAAAAALGEFQGTSRRFELKGEVNGVTVIDDYAHHPTEIRATLAAARTRFGSRPIWAVLQPHTFSRTLTLLTDFANAFDDADHVIVVDIFPSREKDEGLVSSQDMVSRMVHPDARYIGSLAEAADVLAAGLAPDDVLLTLGAGDGYKVGEWVLDKIAHRKENTNDET